MPHQLTDNLPYAYYNNAKAHDIINHPDFHSLNDELFKWGPFHLKHLATEHPEDLQYVVLEDILAATLLEEQLQEQVEFSDVELTKYLNSTTTRAAVKEFVQHELVKQYLDPQQLERGQLRIQKGMIPLVQLMLGVYYPENQDQD